MRFQDFIYEFETIILEMNSFFEDFHAISQQRHRELAVVKSLQQAYRACGASLHAVTTATYPAVASSSLYDTSVNPKLP